MRRHVAGLLCSAADMRRHVAVLLCFTADMQRGIADRCHGIAGLHCPAADLHCSGTVLLCSAAKLPRSIAGLLCRIRGLHRGRRGVRRSSERRDEQRTWRDSITSADGNPASAGRQDQVGEFPTAPGRSRYAKEYSNAPSFTAISTLSTACPSARRVSRRGGGRPAREGAVAASPERADAWLASDDPAASGGGFKLSRHLGLSTIRRIQDPSPL